MAKTNAAAPDYAKDETRICELIGEGTPLREICRMDGMPAWRTVYHWMEDRPDFAARIARARTRGFDAIAEQCLEIADDTANDTKIVGSDDGEREAANTEWISRSKLRVETRLKLLAKWDPKRYGEKIEATHEAGDSIQKIVRELVRPK